MLENVFKDPTSREQLEGLIRNDPRVIEIADKNNLSNIVLETYVKEEAEKGYSAYVRGKKGWLATAAKYAAIAGKIGLVGLAVANPGVALAALPAIIGLSAVQTAAEAPEAIRRATRQGDYLGLAWLGARQAAYAYSPLGIVTELMPDEMRKRQRTFYQARDSVLERLNEYIAKRQPEADIVDVKDLRRDYDKEAA